MVGGVPVGLALRDLFYAAGLGFLLCVGYSAARMLLGSGKGGMLYLRRRCAGRGGAFVPQARP